MLAALDCDGSGQQLSWSGVEIEILKIDNPKNFALHFSQIWL